MDINDNEDRASPNNNLWRRFIGYSCAFLAIVAVYCTYSQPHFYKARMMRLQGISARVTSNHESKLQVQPKDVNSTPKSQQQPATGIQKVLQKSNKTSQKIKKKKNDTSAQGQREKSILSLDWTNLPIMSTWARRIAQHQSNCSLPVTDFWFRNVYGLGSDLHVWSMGICEAMKARHRLQTRPPWIWLDVDVCNATGHNFDLSPMLCYFPKSEHLCGDDVVDEDLGDIMFDSGLLPQMCHNFTDDYEVSSFRAASTEYLFSSLSPVVVHEAERQVKKLFPGGIVPDNIITVYIRWGDKVVEAAAFPIEVYIQSVQSIQQQRGLSDDAISIFLSSEDPSAVTQFKEAAPSDWKVFVDLYEQELTQYRKEGWNGNPLMSEELNGKPGLISLGSLLIAMESRSFVVTTTSNWGRLMNELRKNVIDPRCGNCTIMIDLQSDEYRRL
jgi:hypothetical protein